jgi:xanthine dehydrogenase accessory factor
MDRRLLREALRLMEAHEPFVRATVVQTSGSVPGKLGASMIVRADGSFVGTVGGAALEERVKAIATRAFEMRAGDLHHFDLQAWKEGGLPSLCGGSVDIAVEYVPARPNLLLWGGGHVSFALATILPTLEYDYSVADDRPDWVGVDRFATADRREVVEPARLWRVFEPSAFTHLFVMGYDAGRDLEVLEHSIAEFPNRIGLIASAAKREHMFAALRERGVSRDALSRVNSPVGLDIGAQSPSEIAVSIVAELVQDMHPERRERRPGSRASGSEEDVVPRAP